MWSTLGNLYQKMENNSEASKCLEKAETLKKFDGINLYYLGQVYELLGNKEKTLVCYQQMVSTKDNQQIPDKELSDMLFYMANHYKNINDLDEAL